MDSLQLLAEAIEVAKRLGVEIREELIGDGHGGVCRIRGRKCVFLDSRLGPRERLMQVLSALRGEPLLAEQSLRPALRHLLETR
ncbi:MAG TPA: hypothetical protein VHX65_00120 [Pirellulales bacterium]|nr:hypothetical protein [Pirellulales bacterium]